MVESGPEIPPPYRPGFGARPPVIAGRDEIFDDIDEAAALIAEHGIAPSAFVIVGPRGVGKSVLLDEIARRVQERYGWVHLHVEKLAGQPLNESLITASRDVIAQLEQISDARPHRLTLSELSLSGGLPFATVSASATFRSAEQQQPLSDAAVMQHHLRQLTNAAVSARTAVVVTLDELQGVTKAEFAPFGAFAQEITRLGLPFLIAGAGLRSLDNNRLPTYFVRGERHDIDMLSPAEARRALLEPATSAGRPFTEEAAQLVLDHTGGYPFAVQLYGREVWRASAGAEMITIEAARKALPRAARQLDRSVHRDHWAKATIAEKRYLQAVAQLVTTGEPFSGGDVARVLGQPIASLSGIRGRLLEAGALTYDGARLEFATPGMAVYVLAQDPPPTPKRTRGSISTTPGPGGALNEPRPSPRSSPGQDSDLSR